MRNTALIVGVLLLVAGGLISAGLLGFDQQETVAKIGSLAITNTERRAPPPLWGWGLLGAGVLLVVVGLRAKK